MSSFVIFSLFASMSAHAADLPLLADTNLYQQKVQGCHVVDLAGWHHPVKTLLTKKQIPLHRVELCNQQKYPVFYVEFPYDPMGSTDRYFYPLYTEMKTANGIWPYAFVDEADNTIIEISYSKADTIAPDYERYRTE